ncbi:SBBP repeat-containing protein [Calditrichota bacterium]
MKVITFLIFINLLTISTAIAQRDNISTQQLLSPNLPENISNTNFDVWQKNSMTGGVQEAWLSHYASGLLPGSDNAYALTIDDQNNIYVTGTSYSSSTHKDIIILKYNSSGIIQWTARYNNQGNGPEWANDIAVDAQGNVYVTGSSFIDLVTYEDYITIKYNSSGVEQWVAHYNGPDDSYDVANALTVDTQGNVYVTGRSTGTGTLFDFDFATVKYNSSGEEQWVARHNGSANDWDEANALAVDAQGNIYVTGYSVDSVTGSDYTTIKYNSSGVEQWIVHYNGPGNSSDGANSLVIDDQSNVYITGKSYGLQTSSDYATIKYNSSGVEQWIARYDGPGNSADEAVSLILDNQGNVLVTGGSIGSGTSWDYATIKYNSSGLEQWAARYDGSHAEVLAVDDQDNVYVTGYNTTIDGDNNYATVKYNSSGIEQWVMQYSGTGNDDDRPTAIAVGDQGNVYITGFSIGLDTFYDYVTIKYNSSGTVQWIERYNVPGMEYDQVEALVIDDQGNVYITGFSDGWETDYDYITVKYNSLGVEQWVARYNGLGDSSDVANAISVDDLGNVYVTGKSLDSGSNYDYATIKYNSSGAEQWVAHYNGPGNLNDQATALSVDMQGNVYVTGASTGTGTDFDYATVKYNSSGVEQWVARYNGPGSLDDQATSLALEGQDHVYVTGFSMGSGTDNDYATVKYNTSGIEQWVARYNGPVNSLDEATGLSIDKQGNVYVAGFSVGSGSILDCDYATIKYNSSGSEQWVARYNGPANSYDEAKAIVVDVQGNVYVTGSSAGSFPYLDYATVKYNSSGIEQWVARYNGSGNSQDYANDLTIDAHGNVYVTGYSVGSGTDTEYATLKYNSSGTEQWVALYNGPGSSQATALSVDAQNNVYVTGTNYGTFSILGTGVNWSFITTIKYSQSTTGLEQENVNIPAKYKLEQNYPNPFNPVTNICYDLPKASKVKLEIYNSLGQRVAVLVNEYKPAGLHTIPFDGTNLASGIYYYRITIHSNEIEGDDFIKVKKMLLLR